MPDPSLNPILSFRCNSIDEQIESSRLLPSPAFSRHALQLPFTTPDVTSKAINSLQLLCCKRVRYSIKFIIKLLFIQMRDYSRNLIQFKKNINVFQFDKDEDCKLINYFLFSYSNLR